MAGKPFLNTSDDDSEPELLRSRARLRKLQRPVANHRAKENYAKRQPWHQISEADVNQFLSLLTDAVIEAFHLHDTCNECSDRYLLAMVFIYFKKAYLTHDEYTRRNFFIALYLAHQMEEEREDNRWELLPWALGRNWLEQLSAFIRAKNEMWRKMGFNAFVSARNCHQIMSIEAVSKHKAFARFRDLTHSQLKRVPPTDTKYAPHGPIWQHKAGKAWLLREQSKMEKTNPTIRSCKICHHGVSNTALAKTMMANADTRTTFLDAANIIDADWINSDSHGSSRNVSSLALGLDHDDDFDIQKKIPRRENKIMDDTYTGPAAKLPTNQEKVNAAGDDSRKRQIFIDSGQFKRTKFRPSLDAKTFATYLFADSP